MKIRIKNEITTDVIESVDETNEIINSIRETFKLEVFYTML